MSQQTIETENPVVLCDIEITENKVEKKLSFLDKFLSLWILLAMVSGTLLGYYLPSFRNILNVTKVFDVSLPVFIGLLLMLYPVFCKVKYEELLQIFKERNNVSYLLFSLVMNWIICPLIMTALAWICLPDLPHYRTGVLLIGIARCIAMVLIWNDLAGGNAEWCAMLVSINSVFQMVLFAPLAYFFTRVIGNTDISVSIEMWPVVKNVLVFLGIPFLAGYLTRLFLRRGLRKQLGPTWYDNVFIPFISPLALLGLLYTIFIMFAIQAGNMINEIGPVFRVVVPLVLYFSIVWILTMALSFYLKFPFPIAITQSFTAASNNFELAMAIAIATFGVDSQEALATAIGPLVEVPVLLSLVYLTPVVGRHYNKL